MRHRLSVQAPRVQVSISSLEGDLYYFQPDQRRCEKVKSEERHGRSNNPPFVDNHYYHLIERYNLLSTIYLKKSYVGLSDTITIQLIASEYLVTKFKRRFHNSSTPRRARPTAHYARMRYPSIPDYPPPRLSSKRRGG